MSLFISFLPMVSRKARKDRKEKCDIYICALLNALCIE
jgi:hypothetical protein